MKEVCVNEKGAERIRPRRKLRSQLAENLSGAHKGDERAFREPQGRDSEGRLSTCGRRAVNRKVQKRLEDPENKGEAHRRGRHRGCIISR